MDDVDLVMYPICRRCAIALRLGAEHSCDDWGTLDGRVCGCPAHLEWCDSCGDRHHPPVSSGF